MLAYDWTCSVCAAPNPARTETCSRCGSPAVLTGSDVARRRAALSGRVGEPSPPRERPWWIPEALYTLLFLWE